jgi:hypothetical protein
MSNEKPKKPARRPRIEEQKPFAVTQALRVYAETGDVAKAAEVGGCHARTIRRLIERDEGFCQVKKILAGREFELSAVFQEVAMAKASECSGMQAAVAAKLSAQSGLELTNQGKPLVEINLSDSGLALDAISRLRAELAQNEQEADGSEPTSNGKGGETKES